MKSIIDDEVERLTGPKGRRGGSAVRWGSQESHLVFQGKKLPFKRPRVRERGGKEVRLDSLERFQCSTDLEAEALKQVVLGVATRKYEHAVDEVAEGYEVKKSSVSRR